MKNILLKIRYDGSNFSGWQIQPKKRTVQGELEKILSHIFSKKVSVQGTSRTDSGVHALGQQACFKINTNMPIEKISLVMNNSLKGRSLVSSDLEIIEAVEVDENFHPRFNAVGKRYIYKIIHDKRPDIFKRHYYYQIEKYLNIDKMETAVEYLLGTHDFKSFMASGSNVGDDTVRTIFKAKFHRSDADSNLLVFEIVGDGFLYNMVRIIVGTLMDIGLGKDFSWEKTGFIKHKSVKNVAELMKFILEGKNRSLAGHTAPPGGLYLDKIFFSKEEMLDCSWIGEEMDYEN